MNTFTVISDEGKQEVSTELHYAYLYLDEEYIGLIQAPFHMTTRRNIKIVQMEIDKKNEESI